MVSRVVLKSNIANIEFIQNDLQLAIDSNRTSDVLAILKERAFADWPLSNGQMPLNYAIRYGKLELVKEMFNELQLKTEAKDAQGLTPVDHAMIGGDPKMIALVLGNMVGQNFDEALKNPIPPMQMQQMEDIRNEVEQLRSGRLFVRLPELHRAAREGDLARVEKHLNPLDPNAYDAYGMTPLHHAALAGKKELVQWLLQRGGGKADILTLNGRSLLHLASIGGHGSFVSDLVQIQKLNPNDLDSRGRSSLHYAMALEDLAPAKALIQNGADPLLKTYANFSSLNILLFEAANRSRLRDPLNITAAQFLTFAAIAAPWVAKICGDHPALQFLGSLIQWGQWLMVHENLQSYHPSAAKASFVAHAAHVAGSIYHLASGGGPYYSGDHWSSGLNNAGDTMPRELMGLDAGITTTTCYQIVKSTFRGLANCWENRSLETLRPLRNAVVHSVIGVHTLHFTANRLSSLYENSKIYDAWDRFMNLDSQNCVDPSGAKVTNRTCFQFHLGAGATMSSFLNRNHGVVDCPLVDPTICEGLSVPDCVKKDELKPACEDHARIILGLANNFSGEECRKAFRGRSLLLHPDQNNGDDSLQIKLGAAKSTLKDKCDQRKKSSGNLGDADTNSNSIANIYLNHSWGGGAGFPQYFSL